ncbi:major facilitator superfamily domain-containing protein [Aspergillus pseudodeflectus]|uniref:Major facilitator superfamily domain-containing protein n=1 Tax=Aspergillus pseudodeflectus TaxID=176178 RepID=A0ABR4KTP2_9EURO
MGTQREATVDAHDTRIEQVPVSDAALLRRIDWRIIPIMFLAYFLQFLDKVVLNYANVMGIQADLGMSGNGFSWLATAFFIAYCIAEIPQGFLLHKYPIPKVLGCNMLIWGITICCTAAAQNYAGILALRIILGTTEAVIAPALTIYTSLWYTSAEATPRFGLWYCGLGTGQILGGLISFGAQHAPSSLSFAGWRIMFVVVGAVNISVALLVLTFLPNNPHTSPFLSLAEKTHLANRLSTFPSLTLNSKTIHIPSLYAALTDPQTHLLVLLTILTCTPSGLITTFSALLIRNFGYTSREAALLNMPSGVVSIVSTLCATIAIARGYPRWLAINVLLVPTLVGACLISFLPPEGNEAGCLVGIYLVNTTVAPLALIFAWTGANFKNTTMKVTGCAAVSAGFGIANIIGPQTFQARDAPDYTPAKITIVAVNASAMVVSTALRVLYGMRNARAQGRGPGGEARGSIEGRFMKDGNTVVESPGFRYVY